MISKFNLKDDALRMLKMNNKVIISKLTHVKFIVTNANVIHSFACLALNIKCDVYLNKLNQVFVFINKQDTFYDF